jgi:integrase/recombinase XerD
MPRRQPTRRYTLGQPHITRRRGKAGFWWCWIEGREISLGTQDRREAQRRLDQLAAERRAAPSVLAAARSQQGLPELVALYAEDCRARQTPKTAASYGGRLLLFVQWAESRGIRYTEQVTYPVLTQYIQHRKKDQKAGAATINRDLTAIRRMFVFGRRQGRLTAEPVGREAFSELRLREPKAKPNAMTLSPETVDKIVTKAGELLEPVYAKLIEFVAGSGVRIDEARHIDEENIDVTRGVLTLTPKKGWTTKNYRYRDVPISKQTAEAALSFIELRSEQTLDDKTLWNLLQKVRKAAGVEPMSMHDLRRAWASAMHANGASIKQVSVWLGHAEIATTERYIRVFTDVTDGHQFLPR